MSGRGSPCSPTAAEAPPPPAPFVAAEELADGLFAKVREELEEGREREVYLRMERSQLVILEIPYPILLNSLGVRGRRLMYL